MSESELERQHLLAVGRLAQSSTLGWQGVVDLLNKYKEEAQQCLMEASSLVDIHRAQGQLLLLDSFFKDVEHAKKMQEKDPGLGAWVG